MRDNGERDETVPVTLSCFCCGRVETIHVFRERELPRRISWECLECQKRAETKEEKPQYGSGSPPDLVKTP